MDGRYDSYSHNLDPAISHCIDHLITNPNDAKYTKITKLLLNHNISPNVVSQIHKSSLLHYGCQANDIHVIKELVFRYNIDTSLALRFDNDGKSAMDYLNTASFVGNAIQTFIEQQIAEKQWYPTTTTVEKTRIDSSDYIGYFYSGFMIIICCFMFPWCIISVFNSYLVLSQVEETNNWMLCGVVSFVMVNVALFVLFVCRNRRDADSVSMVSMYGLMSVVIIQQMFSLGLFVLQVVLEKYTRITVTLSIANMALFALFYAMMYCFVKNL